MARQPHFTKKARDKLVELLKSDAIRESRKARQEMAEKCLRLASVSHERCDLILIWFSREINLKRRRGIEYQECWREGYLFQEIQDRLLSVGREKDTIEKNKKTLMKRLKMGASLS